MDNKDHHLVFLKSDIFSALFFRHHYGYSKTKPNRVRDDIGHGIYCERYDEGWYVIEKSSGYRIFYGKKRLTVKQLYIHIIKLFIELLQDSVIWVPKTIQTIDGHRVKVRFNGYTSYETDTEIVTCRIKEVPDRILPQLIEFSEYGFSINLSALKVDEIRFSKPNH